MAYQVKLNKTDEFATKLILNGAIVSREMVARGNTAAERVTSAFSIIRITVPRLSLTKLASLTSAHWSISLAQRGINVQMKNHIDGQM